MKTPICDFVEKYAKKDNLRLHMPGHKGVGSDMHKRDITEIRGADSLYEASGIIAESERYASEIFSSRTYYSTEGSSLAIRAMLYLATLCRPKGSGKVKIAAARNVHKVFVSAAALLDFEVDWICSDSDTYLSSGVNESDVERYLLHCNELPIAVYVTSPDYLGCIANISGIARVCHSFGVMLLVDNAHGAYLKFLNDSLHPIDLGADMCADSAHKTLPALTGAAYLHLSDRLDASLIGRAKNALMLFGSTSPSYLTLASLDSLNPYLDGAYREELGAFISCVDKAKAALSDAGYKLVGNEPMKITVAAKSYGYTGTEISEYLATLGIESEFSDPDFTVFMPTPQTEAYGLERLTSTLLSLPKRDKITEQPPKAVCGEQAITIREAVFSDEELLPVEACRGRILSSMMIGCPPAVPIAVSGEIITEETVECFRYYGIDECAVVK